MLLEKEYPATHSMSTAWYLVDEDDNVGMMDFDDNGPIPFGTPSEEYVEELASGYALKAKETHHCPIRYTKEQLKELLGRENAPAEQAYWGQVVVRIDPAKKEQFLALLSEAGVTHYWCMSEEEQLYFTYSLEREKLTDKDTGKETSLLEELLDKGILLGGYDWELFWMDVDYEGDEPKLEKYFETAPFYMYAQPYSPNRLQHRLHVPEHPVKLSQIEARHRGRFLRIPRRFSELPQMQIARYLPCDLGYVDDPQVQVDGSSYLLLPDEDGGQIYALYEAFSYKGLFEQLVPPTEGKRTYGLSWFIDSPSPTVLFIASPRKRHLHPQEGQALLSYKAHLAPCCYIPQFYAEGLSPYEDRESYKIVLPQMTDELLLSLLKQGQGYLQTLTEHIRPQVIVLEDEALAIFSQVFPIEGHTVTIGGERYPLYLISELEAERAVVDELAQRPYRGREVRLFYTEAEMQELLRQGIAQGI